MANEPPRAYNILPGTRSLRACMLCSILLPSASFMRDGCPNCDPILGLKGSADNVNECTSSNYNGTIALTQPKTSWVAKWMRLDTYVPGVYAVQVVGMLPEEVLENVRLARVVYVPRDGRKDEGAEME